MAHHGRGVDGRTVGQALRLVNASRATYSRRILRSRGVGDFETADVLIDGRKIVAVRPQITAPNAQVIDASRMIVMPGLVDTHRHIWEGILRNIFPDAFLGDYFRVITGTLQPRQRSRGRAKRTRVLLVTEREGLEYAPDAVTFEKAGYGDVEHGAALIVFGPRGIPRPVAERLERAFVEAAKSDPFVSVARRTEMILGEPLVGRPLVDYLRKLSAGYEELIKEAGVYKSEKK